MDENRKAVSNAWRLFWWAVYGRVVPPSVFGDGLADAPTFVGLLLRCSKCGHTARRHEFWPSGCDECGNRERFDEVKGG